jgi:hypothetical protein
MGGIFDDGEAVLMRQDIDLVEVTRVAGPVDRHDRARSVGYPGADRGAGNVPGLRIDVSEDGDCALH